MSAQSPSGPPSQPQKGDAYIQKPNPVERLPSENAVSDTPATSDPYGSGNDYISYRSSSMSQPSEGQQPNPQPQERGVRGGGPTNAREAKETHYANSNSNSTYGSHPLREAQNANEDADDQMAPAGEGKVAHAVERANDRAGDARRRESSAQRHGRTRGEVSLDGDEADLERYATHNVERKWYPPFLSPSSSSFIHLHHDSSALHAPCYY